MDVIKTNIIDAIGHCIGYGPENAKYFFFGLEEKGKFDFSDTNRISAYLEKYNLKGNRYYSISNEDIYLKCKDCKSIDQVNAIRSKIYSAYIRIYGGISKDNFITNELIGSKHKPILSGNLYSFGKHKNKDFYTREENEWIEENQKNRTEFIINFIIEKSKDNYVFCFGSINEYLEYFKDSIKFGDPKHFIEYAHRSNIYYKAKDINLFLLRHPSNGWLSYGQINELLTYIKSG